VAASGPPRRRINPCDGQPIEEALPWRSRRNLSGDPKGAIRAVLRSLMALRPGLRNFTRAFDEEPRQRAQRSVLERDDPDLPMRRQPRREGERNEALDTTVYAMAALHGVISMGLQLNKEADAIGVSPRKGAPIGKLSDETTRGAQQVIRSRWMG
jgi:hypothetical protein